MMTQLLIGGALAAASFTAFVASRPADFHLQRSIRIAAPPERAFALVNDFRSWGDWSPWEKLDASMKRTYSGPESGVGSVYAWESSGKAGVGRMTLERSDRPSLVTIHLEFIKPFPGESTATFSFAPVGDGTRVTWAMDGKSNFVAKAFHVFVDVDQVLGKEFERGLSAMKSLAEKETHR